METQKLPSEVLFEPQPKQTQFIEAIFSGKYSFLCYGGSVGGGKSYVCIATLILLCKIYPKSKWVIIRQSLPTLKRTSIETFKKVLPVGFLKSYNQTEHIATFKNDSQITFMPEDYQNDKDFDRFKGLEVNGFLLEQIEELQQGLLDVCIMRAGRHRLPKMPKPIILANVNPTQTWAKKFVYERYKNGTLPSDWYYLPATIFDNPVLANDNDYMSRLKNLDELTYRRLINGDWSAFAVNNPFLYGFNDEKHIGECSFDPYKELYLSFDFNVDPITCISCQHYDDKIFIIDEFRLPNSDIYELCKRIHSKYPNALIRVTGDATGQNRSALTKGNMNYYTIIQLELGLADAQMDQPTINPAVSDSRVLCNSILQNYPVTISPNCVKLIEDCKYVEVDDKGDIKKDRSSEYAKADLLDGFRYYLNTYFDWFLNLRQE